MSIPQKWGFWIQGVKKLAGSSAKELLKNAELRINGYGLTQRERQVINLLKRGLSNNEIADMLVVSVHTIKDHLKNIFHKTGANNRTDLVCRLYGL